MNFGREDYNKRIIDQHNRIPNEEPVFLIRGQDSLAIKVMGYWVKQATKQNGGKPTEAIASVKRHINVMRAWKYRKLLPDVMDVKRVSVSDGCTMFPDGDWSECCITHDRDYENIINSDDRKKADLQLMACVVKKGHPFVALIMYIGVRIGGRFSWFRSKKRGARNAICRTL